MKIAVVDGQGGGIGKVLVEKLRGTLEENIEILALGTNALATAAMLKAGADEGASGESAIIVNAPKVDIITGCIGILAAGSMLGEITSNIATAISMSSADKVLIPLGKCMIHIAGVVGKPLPRYIEDAVAVIRNRTANEKTRETDVYLQEEGESDLLLMAAVEKVVPEEDGIYLENINGEHIRIQAKIKRMEFTHHRLILEKI